MSQEEDRIADLEDEVRTLREVRDELMEENERLRGEIKSREEAQGLKDKGGE